MQSGGPDGSCDRFHAQFISDLGLARMILQLRQWHEADTELRKTEGVRQRYDAIHKATPPGTISDGEAWERTMVAPKYPSCWGDMRGTAKAGKEVRAIRQAIRDVPQAKDNVRQECAKARQAEQTKRWQKLHPKQKACV